MTFDTQDAYDELDATPKENCDCDIRKYLEAALARIAELKKEVAEKDAYINDDTGARLNLAMVKRIVELENDKQLFDQTFAGNCFELMKQLVGHGAYFPEPDDAKKLSDLIEHCRLTGNPDTEILKRYLRTMK